MKFAYIKYRHAFEEFPVIDKIDYIGDFITGFYVTSSIEQKVRVQYKFDHIIIEQTVTLPAGRSRLPYFDRYTPYPASSLCYLQGFIYLLAEEPAADLSIIAEHVFFDPDCFKLPPNFILSLDDDYMTFNGGLHRTCLKKIRHLKQTRAKNTIRRQLPTMLRHLYRPDGPMLRRFIAEDYADL